MTKRILFVDTPTSRQLREDAEAACARINHHIYTRNAQLMAEGKLDANGNVIAGQMPPVAKSSFVVHTALRRPSNLPTNRPR